VFPFYQAFCNFGWQINNNEKHLAFDGIISHMLNRKKIHGLVEVSFFLLISEGKSNRNICQPRLSILPEIIQNPWKIMQDLVMIIQYLP